MGNTKRLGLILVHQLWTDRNNIQNDGFIPKIIIILRGILLIYKYRNPCSTAVNLKKQVCN